MREFHVYILASKSHRLYVGVTNDVVRRVYEHKNGWALFTARYRIDQLVYYETQRHPMQAIRREKQIKRLSRAQKMELIESGNPCWVDLAHDWFDPPSNPRNDSQ
jgi:putative endonuclease